MPPVPPAEPFARAGFLALATVNSMASVVPHGGHRKLYGTNPMGFAVPRSGADPLVFDQASSAMANGAVQIARRQGRALPPGTGGMPRAPCDVAHAGHPTHRRAPPTCRSAGLPHTSGPQGLLRCRLEHYIRPVGGRARRVAVQKMRRTGEAPRPP